MMSEYFFMSSVSSVFFFMLYKVVLLIFIGILNYEWVVFLFCKSSDIMFEDVIISIIFFMERKYDSFEFYMKVFSVLLCSESKKKSGFLFIMYLMILLYVFFWFMFSFDDNVADVVLSWVKLYERLFWINLFIWLLLLFERVCGKLKFVIDDLLRKNILFNLFISMFYSWSGGGLKDGLLSMSRNFCWMLSDKWAMNLL